MKILLTGTLGFIGSNFIRYATKHIDAEFIGIDKAVYPYNLLNSYSAPNYRFYFADIADSHIINAIFEAEKPDMVIGFAAESFVDNSISNITPFLHTNILGTQCLIDACLKHHTDRYIHISTDECYGQQLSRQDRAWTEGTPLAPRNPYAASKAAAELIVRTAHETHGLQYQMTRSCNVFGPRQKKENLIPHIIHSLNNQSPINIHGNGQNFRQYIYVQDKIDAILHIIKYGKMNETYNIGAYNYFSNLEMIEQIEQISGKFSPINYIENRKAHDFGYSVSNAKLQLIGWKPKHSFKEALTQTIRSYD